MLKKKNMIKQIAHLLKLLICLQATSMHIFIVLPLLVGVVTLRRLNKSSDLF